MKSKRKNEVTENLLKFICLLEIRALVLQEHLDGNDMCGVELTLTGTEVKIGATQKDKCSNAVFFQGCYTLFFCIIINKREWDFDVTQTQLGAL